MSFAGLETFKANLEKVMSSEAFKNASEGDKLRIGGALLNSRYGVGTLGVVKPFPDKNKESI